MTTTIEIDAKIANELRKRADERGVAIESYIEMLLQLTAPPLTFEHREAASLGRPKLATPSARALAFEQWARSHRHNILLPDSAMNRESFYDDRG